MRGNIKKFQQNLGYSFGRSDVPKMASLALNKNTLLD